MFGVSQTTKFWYNAAGNRVKKQVFNHMAPLENGADTSSVTYYVRDANEAVMAIYQQKVIHTSGMFGCLRKPSNNVGGDSDLDGVVDGSCDNCSPSMPGGLPGGEWNPWQEDYDRDGVGDACDPCPYHGELNNPCGGPILPPQPEVWTGIAVTTTLAELPIYGSERLGLMRPNAMRDTSFYPGAIFTRQLDKKAYELKDHLGNVRVVVSDLKGKEVTGIIARVKSVNNYYAFGMLEEGMSGSSGGYRYGFQGQEMDNEINGVGNFLAYEYRIHDPRLGKFLSIDPLSPKYPSQSPYVFSENRVIASIELEGLEAVDVNDNTQKTNTTPENLEAMTNAQLADEFKDLIEFKPSSDVIESAQQRVSGLHLQNINNASCDQLNLDYFSLTINQLPPGVSQEALFNTLRINFSMFTSGAATTFGALNESENGYWTSEPYPLSAVMHFDVGLELFGLVMNRGDSYLPLLNPDDLSVIAAKTQSQYWVFSAVHTQQDQGHPIAGNRQFGIANSGSTSTFFIRGADRPYTILDHHAARFIFTGADNLWHHVINKMVIYINSIGGSASANPAFSQRISWHYDYLKQNPPLGSPD